MSHRLINAHKHAHEEHEAGKGRGTFNIPPPDANLRGKRRQGSKRRGCEEEEEMLGEEGREEKDVCHSEWQNTTVVFLYMLYVIYVYIYVCIYIYMYKHGIRCILLCAKLHNVQPHAGTRSTAARMLRTLYYYICVWGEGDEKGGAICT